MLDIKEVTVRYGGLTAVNNMTISLNEGEIIALIGPNGAGKTTLLNAISGFVKPNEGQILYNDKDWVGKQPHEINQAGIARTFQLIRIFKLLTVMENVMVSTHRYNKNLKNAALQAKEILSLTQLENKSNRITSELNLIDQKKVELARALATKPKILLLDEVITGLTGAEIEEMIELIRKIRDMGVGILFIEHIMYTVVKLAGRVVVMKVIC